MQKKSDASIILRSVVLADIIRSSRRKYRPCVVVHWFCRPILSGN